MRRKNAVNLFSMIRDAIICAISISGWAFRGGTQLTELEAQRQCVEVLSSKDA